MIAAATMTTCEACFLPAVCEVSETGEWETRCPNCGTDQIGLPGFPPPPAADPDAPVALGLGLGA